MFWKKEEPFVMGILNVTPDSFYDGGKHNPVESALKCALKMFAEGADVIDIGGESTRPGSKPISLEEECSRVLPVVEAIRKESKLPISLDTTKAELVRRALELGSIEMINDISALRGDPKMAEMAAQSGAAIILMHMQGTPETMQQDPDYQDVVKELVAFFEERIAFAENLSIPKEKILIDPGIGFGKKQKHNLELLNRLDEFQILGCPIVVGPSRKSFIGCILGNMEEDRIWGTAAAVTTSVLKGAKGIRVHDVKAMRQAAQTAFQIVSPSL